MLPFVLLSYGKTSEYIWTDCHGRSHVVSQAEGGEQGDPLMPLLFSLGIHDALAAVSEKLLPGEHLFAFLDDVYAVSSPERTRAIYDMLAQELRDHAGIRLHEGKTVSYTHLRAHET